ncbi:hypothetical protein QQF64_028843 [Cirrhinus molitorella]|uniref:Anaphase-promoting complex subunit 11 n=19 Tax=Ostariophysi TaxID=32519 RepID=A0ABR3N7R6_9TELE
MKGLCKTLDLLRLSKFIRTLFLLPAHLLWQTFITPTTFHLFIIKNKDINIVCLINDYASVEEMKVKIKQWNGVASWLWVANDENCGICRAPFNGCCPDCKVPGDDCPLVWGQCSHCFHMHCILKWLNSQQVQQQCPMCRQEWKFKEGDTS